MVVKHAKTSGKSDGGDATLVQPSDWNGDHVGGVSHGAAASAAQDYAARIKLAGDTEYRAVLGLDASDVAFLVFGSGAAIPPGTYLSHVGDGQLAIGTTPGDSNGYLNLWALQFYTGDIRLRRTAALTLEVDDGGAGPITLNVVGTLQVNGSPVGANLATDQLYALARYR